MEVLVVLDGLRRELLVVFELKLIFILHFGTVISLLIFHVFTQHAKVIHLFELALELGP